LSTLNAIKKSIDKEMSLFDEKFSELIKGKQPLVDKIMTYILKSKGKKIRPILVLLCAKSVGKVNESTYRAASMIELLHTATLIHDDVVDDANIRRGFFSINALWKNKAAVLIGDYLLSKGLLLAVKNKEFALLKIISSCVEEMSVGELLQIEKSRKLDITEPIYFDIIRKKTAALISACCESGAISTAKDMELVKKMKLFGEKAGIAYQIKDDLLDYEKTSIIGKPSKTDIKEKKITLPLIYTLNKVNELTRKKIIRIIKNEESENFIKVLEVVKNEGGLNYAEKIMNQYKDEAKKILDSFKNSDEKKSLQALLNYMVKRKK
tara:strand:+ start:2862 stop:3830 length:969 start_codon:yes stop_codon:yes gene_type:complete